MLQRTHARTAFAAIMIVALSGFGVLFAASAGAGQGGSLVVDKVVEGEAPPGTQYTIRLSCVTEANPVPQISQVVLNGPGNAIDAAIVAGNTCTITEPEDGGATSVTFSCEVTGGPAVCDAAGNRITFPIGSVSTGTITVTNSFEPPPPPAPEPAAEALVLEPAFTG